MQEVTLFANKLSIYYYISIHIPIQGVTIQ